MGVFVTCQKQKLLLIQKILLEKTDENNSLTVQQIINELEKYDIKAERKTIYDDITTLTDFGMNIAVTKIGHSNAYYVSERLFIDEELQILADAVASSKFLTTKKSNELIKKLQTLTSVYNAKQLRRSIYVENRVKTFNESIYYNINAIHDAVAEKKKITFKYYEYNFKKEKQLKHGGELYSVSPYHLIWESDNYYLVCFCEKHQTICRYRVDRMSDVQIAEDITRELSKEESDEAKNLRSTYSMFSGETETVTLELDKSLISVIVDRYGDKASIREKDAQTVFVRIEVQISPPFWGWLFQFGKKARLIAPQNVVNQAKQWLDGISQMY